MGRAPCCEKVGLKRGRWTDEEDRVLTNYIQAHGEGSWRSLPKNAGLLRCGKSCRLRWINYLRSDLKRGNISSAEEDIIIKLHESLGNRWSIIAGHLPGRTDNEIKNYWNSHLMKKIPTPVSDQPQQQTPVTHLPKPPKKPRGKKTKSSQVVEEIVPMAPLTPMTEEEVASLQEQETFGDGTEEGGLILSDSAFNDDVLFHINVFNDRVVDNFDGGMQNGLEFWETEMEKMDMSWLWEAINDEGESQSDKQNAMV